jgi:1-deoxy-D-xylulose-5-phosphate reductoisomerase
MTRRVIILGSTGSIGTQTLEVIAHLNALHERGEFPDRFEVVGLACGKNRKLMDQQAARFGVKHLACAELVSEHVADVAQSCYDDTGCKGFYALGHSAAVDMIHSVECDLVVAAMVGSAGIRATLAAVELGRDVALANKETLVAAGSLIIPAAKRSGSKLLPIDSEHAALWQCLGAAVPPPFTAAPSLSRAILTASGGPFRTWARQQIWDATPQQALKHPTWSMGRKVTIDSASLLNKGLEIIEAHWLFGIPGDRIDALVHPQSLVHAMAEFSDGNVIAQLAAPDMRTPIQHALAWPRRTQSISRPLDWASLRTLDFEPVDHERFPLLRLAYKAIAAGGTAGAILNAANEEAVNAFLASADAHKPMRFGRVIELVLEATESIKPVPMRSLEDCLYSETTARNFIHDQLGRSS